MVLQLPHLFRGGAAMLLLAAALCLVQGGELSVSPRLESDMALARAVEYLLAGRGEDGLWGEDAVSAEAMMALHATGFQGEFSSVRSVFDQAWDRLSAKSGRFSPLALSHVIRVLRRKGDDGAKAPSGNWLDWEASARRLTGAAAPNDVGECAALLDALYLENAPGVYIAATLRKLRSGDSPLGLAVADSSEGTRPISLSVLEMSEEMLYWYARAWFPFEDQAGQNWRNAVVIRLLETQTSDGGWGNPLQPVAARLRSTAFAMQAIILARWQ
ncbi:MAG: hypothetical protein IJJ33_08620 [Victivallales bacterium]|nr:hypothetical protein [Victivallales bacterium]